VVTPAHGSPRSLGRDDDVVTLALDAATAIGTVAVLRGRRVVAEGEAAMRDAETERLMPAVLAALRVARCEMRDVARVVCGAGPGSFTSLRVAAAIAKGVALGNGAPLFGASSLALIVAGRRNLPSGRWLALLDAMRGDRFAALVTLEADGTVRLEERLGLLRHAEVADTCVRLAARAIGPLEDTAAPPHARGAALLLRDVVAAGEVSVDAWEPEYGRLAEAQVRWEAAHGRTLPR